jgi:signal transduction histidine kinase
MIALIIADNGRGFPLEGIWSNGLAGLCERVHLCRGKIKFESLPQGGTSMHIQIPHEKTH